MVARGERERPHLRRRLEGLLRRYPRRPGTPVLRRVLALDGGPAFLRSEAEARFLDLVRRAELPRPLCNARERGYEVDFLWRRQRLVVEVDGRRDHASRSAFERDRTRDAVLGAAGFRVIRVTWRMLTRTPEAVVARVAQALTREASE